MNREDAEEFAREWVQAWCERDVARVVSHFTENAHFVSPVAAKRTGNALVTGRQALSDYWQVVHSFTSFRFELERAVWDQDGQILAIIYRREIDGRQDRACEILRFNTAGEVNQGEAMYGTEGPGAGPIW